MDPDLHLAELQAIHAELVTLNTTTTALQSAEAEWHAQSLFLLEACALGVGILWGCCTWRLLRLAMSQRNPFW